MDSSLPCDRTDGMDERQSQDAAHRRQDRRPGAWELSRVGWKPSAIAGAGRRQRRRRPASEASTTGGTSFRPSYLSSEMALLFIVHGSLGTVWPVALPCTSTLSACLDRHPAPRQSRECNALSNGPNSRMSVVGISPTRAASRTKPAPDSATGSRLSKLVPCDPLASWDDDLLSDSERGLQVLRTVLRKGAGPESRRLARIAVQSRKQDILYIAPSGMQPVASCGL